ncbi:unnamed protein product [Protopolystoma xenopodis]|uniref:Uncharacterized protein n=1 Tax=Protopolystoma xenopodis TaxID=117903 RepID=A0A448WVY3_9PLAT|nr:unnamed protein product [Protopolystoma xenopodis]
MRTCVSTSAAGLAAQERSGDQTTGPVLGILLASVPFQKAANGARLECERYHGAISEQYVVVREAAWSSPIEAKQYMHVEKVNKHTEGSDNLNQLKHTYPHADRVNYHTPNQAYIHWPNDAYECKLA